MQKILRLPAVKAMTGLSRTFIYLNIQKGVFPRPVRLGARAVGWVESELQGWLADRIKESRNTAGPANRDRSSDSRRASSPKRRYHLD